MKFSQDAIRRIVDTTRRDERRPIRSPAPPAPPRFNSSVHWGIVKTTIPAAVGLKKKKGTVDLICDKGDGSGDDKVYEQDVEVWNGFQTAITPASSGKVRRVLVGMVDGLRQILSADCPL